MEFLQLRRSSAVIAGAVMAFDLAMFWVALATPRRAPLNIWLGTHVIMAVIVASLVTAITVKQRQHRRRDRRGAHRREVMRQLLEFPPSRHRTRY